MANCVVVLPEMASGMHRYWRLVSPDNFLMPVKIRYVHAPKVVLVYRNHPFQRRVITGVEIVCDEKIECMNPKT